MKRKRIVRVQLFLLGLVVVLIVWRLVRGPVAPGGLVVLSGLDSGELAARAFELDADGLVLIDAVGSVEAEGSEELAAYGWLVRRDSRELMWKQDPARSEIERTRMSTQDSVRLEAGAYEMYFTSFGATENSRSGRGALGLKVHWANDAKYWRFVVSPREDIGRAVRFENQGWDGDAFWSSGTIGNRTRKTGRIRVEEPSEVRIYAIAEICVRECDVARITRLGEEDGVWEMTRENTQSAGGMQRNRVFDDVISLEPGIYEVLVETDRSHAARSWRANPPYDPLGWGLRMFPVSGAVSEYDPWVGPEPLVSFREVGNDADLEAVFEVSETTRLVVVATGEVGSGDTVYDYAWIESDSGKIWTMSVDASEAAGGDGNNRSETAFVTLEPGTYSLRYVSDGSHAFGDWRRTKPTVPSRWGVSLFPREAGDAATVTVISEGRRETAVVESGVPTEVGIGTLPSDRAMLFGATRLGNDVQKGGRFTLPEKTRIRIVAVGELSESGRYDYGWLDRADGERIWEMTRRNTQPAGGNDINRLFDGILELDPGEYEVGFTTDFSHSYGDFGGGDPRMPQRWGIRVFRLDS